MTKYTNLDIATLLDQMHKDCPASTDLNGKCNHEAETADLAVHMEKFAKACFPEIMAQMPLLDVLRLSLSSVGLEMIQININFAMWGLIQGFYIGQAFATQEIEVDRLKKMMEKES